MNLNPNQPDLPQDADPIDEALLDEALAEPTPAELEAKILELTDPQMLSLLDEALAPEAVPDGLTQRILAATTAGLSHVEAHDESPAVVARIGPSVFRYAAAAAIALAVGLGVYYINQGPEGTNSTIATSVVTPSGTVDDTNDDSLPDWMGDDQFASTGYFDSATSPLEDVLEEAADSLEGVSITRDTLWAELDAYEQFLDDIES